MNDDVDARLRDGLRGVPLPAAPEALRDYLAELGQQPSTAHRRRRARLWVALVPLAAVLLVGIIALMGGSSPQPSPTSSPTASTASPAASTAASSVTPTTPGSGFTRPGFAFDPPQGWTDQIAAGSYPGIPGLRFFGYLVRGMTKCPEGYASPPPTPAGCEESPTRPGTATLAISAMSHQYPWVLATLYGRKTTIAGYPSLSSQGDTEADWTIQSPDGGIYQLILNSPKDEMAANVAAVTRALGSLRLTTWEPPPTVVNGLVHEDTGRGFSFDYPAGWVRYYPTDHTMFDGGRAVVTVASSPLLPPSTSNSGFFSTPPDTVALEFLIGCCVPSAPDWSTATLSLGGQPAFDFGPWGPVDGAMVGHSLAVRLPDGAHIDIDVRGRGPNTAALHTASDEVLQSLVITPTPSPTP